MKEANALFSIGTKLRDMNLGGLASLLILGLVGLGLALSGSLTGSLLRLDILIVDRHGLVDLGNERVLILKSFPC
jgi:hypothetical protein